MTVPIGFIYVQYPNQTVPEILWPNTSWTDISSNFAGLFFRALGGGAASFGDTQGENNPRVSQVSSNFPWKVDAKCDKNVNLNPGSSQCLRVGYFKGGDTTYQTAVSELNLYSSSGEVRPRNTAVRIWKRIN